MTISSITDQFCKACGAEAGEPWETDPEKMTKLRDASRLFALPLHDQRPEDLVVLCDKCAEGFAELRAKWAQCN